MVKRLMVAALLALALGAFAPTAHAQNDPIEFDGCSLWVNTYTNYYLVCPDTIDISQVAHNVCGMFESWDLVPDPDEPIAEGGGFREYLFRCEYPTSAGAARTALQTLKE
jgi:hypothetical protein